MRHPRRRSRQSADRIGKPTRDADRAEDDLLITRDKLEAGSAKSPPLRTFPTHSPEALGAEFPICTPFRQSRVEVIRSAISRGVSGHSDLPVHSHSLEWRTRDCDRGRDVHH